jgi:two-component system response regulator YesN
MPWTVLIADDEPKIRRGLTQLLASHAQEFTVVGEAEDGERALEMISACRPDLLLVDIRMPFVDGLELIGRLVAAEGENNLRVVVISGHDEFDYARQALGLGVFDFLLKPVDEDVLIGTLRRAAADLGRARAKDTQLLRARELAAKNRPVLIEGFFREALAGGLSPADWDETAAFLGLHFQGTPQLALVATGESPGPAGRPLWAGLALRRVAEEAFAGFPNLLLSWDDPGTLAVLAEEDRDEVWTRALDQLEHRAREVLGLVVSVDRVPVPGFPATLASIWEDLVVDRRDRSPHGTLATLALNVLERRFKEPELSLDDLAVELQVSPGHLSRVLKQATGVPFVEALARVRVRKATILLGDPSVKMYEVAERVGYSSQHYFSRAFRRVLGVAPTDYRRGGR